MPYYSTKWLNTKLMPNDYRYVITQQEEEISTLKAELKDIRFRRNKTTDNLRNEIKELKEDIKHLDNLVGYLKEELSKSKTKENEQYREDKRQGRLEV